MGRKVGGRVRREDEGIEGREGGGKRVTVASLY